MAMWKQLTDLSKTAVYVNLDAVALMQMESGGTKLIFAGDAGQVLIVKEIPDDILKA